ncbi:unnamed protein product [Lathyrus oleraceus]
MARLRPKEEYTSNALRVVVEKIDLLVVLAREGSFVLEPRHDTLIEATKIDEHGGRVHGVGEGVNLRLYYGSSRKSIEQMQKEKIDHFEKTLE